MNANKEIQRTPRILHLVVQFLLIIHIAVGQPLYSQTRILPDAGWVKIYFSSIDNLTRHLGLKPLRSAKIKAGDLEVRIWSGFGITGNRGLMIKRLGNKWSAFSLSDPQGTQSINGIPVGPSIKGEPGGIRWAEIWGKMEQAGIAEVRDDSEIPHCSEVLDGISYVVEIAKADYYRTYMVANPQIQRSEDGDKFLRVMSILQKALGDKSRDELANLPVGEEKIVGAISGDTSRSGEALDGQQYTVGKIPQESSIVRLPTEERAGFGKLDKGISGNLA